MIQTFTEDAPTVARNDSQYFWKASLHEPVTLCLDSAEWPAARGSMRLCYALPGPRRAEQEDLPDLQAFSETPEVLVRPLPSGFQIIDNGVIWRGIGDIHVPETPGTIRLLVRSAAAKDAMPADYWLGLFGTRDLDTVASDAIEFEVDVAVVLCVLSVGGIALWFFYRKATRMESLTRVRADSEGNRS